jgi:hypothetical protein
MLLLLHLHRHDLLATTTATPSDRSRRTGSGGGVCRGFAVGARTGGEKLHGGGEGDAAAPTNPEPHY